MNLAHLLARAARVMPDHAAVRLGTATILDYRGLAARAARLAAAMRRHFGLMQGDRVLIVMHNEPAYLEALFACWWAGLVAVPVNAKLHAREVAYILEDSGAGLVLASPELADNVADLPDMTPLLLSNGKQWHRLAEQDEAAIIHPTAAGDPAWLFYTSGTTGRPKGAVLSHRNLFAMTGAYLGDVDPTVPVDAIIHAAPMSHGSGLYILPHVAAMATHVIPESGGFDAAELCSLIATTPGASFFAAPTMVHRLVQSPMAQAADTRNLRTIVYGGGPMYLADCHAALALFGPKLAQIYGQGESPMTITVLPKRCHVDHAAAKLSSVGFAQWPVEVIVADEQDHPLPSGNIGQILVRGDSVMSGYWRRPDATAETLRGGWLHTGDMGEFDQEGFLTLRDRSKDVIISGGTNIYPREVEEVLLQDRRVREAAVVGRFHPDWGEEVVAFIVAGEPVSPTELDVRCTASIARFKRPKEYRFVSALPKNHYGKVLKSALRDLAAQPVKGSDHGS